jgi:hypothetical protein
MWQRDTEVKPEPYRDPYHWYCIVCGKDLGSKQPGDAADEEFVCDETCEAKLPQKSAAK